MTRKKTMSKFAFIGLVVILSATNLFGGPKDFSSLVYNTDRDFNGVFVYTIIQDDDDFLWIGSDDGLYRFDGKQMLNLNEKDSTINTLVTASVISKDGHVYMGYYQGGISIVEHGKYRKLLHKEDLPNKINQLRIDGQKHLWGLSQNMGLVKIENDSASFYSHELLRTTISYDFFIHHDQFFIATNQGVMEFKIVGEQLKYIGTVRGTEDLQVNSVHQDIRDEDYYWIGTSDGLFTYAPQIVDQAKLVHGLPDHMEVSSLAMDELNTLWVGTNNHGLVEVDLINNHEIKAITVFNRENGFESNQIGHVFVDEENEVWVGTFGRGLVQLNRSYFHHYELYQNLNVEGVHGIANFKEDELILGTESGLVHVYHKSERDSLIFDRIEFTSQYTFLTILVHDEIIWGGTRKSGLLKIDLRNETIEKIFLKPLDLVPFQMIRDIKMDNEENIWVAAAGNGVYKITQAGELLEHMNTRSGFYHNEIFSVFPDQAGNVWFGSHATGLALLPKEGEMKYLSKDEIFPSFDVNTIIQDKSGMIWITTEGYGIFSFDGESFRQYTHGDGLLSDFCNAAIVDEIGQIWIGHRLGISLIQPEYHLIRTFHHPGELGETEAERNSVCKDVHGNIFFGNPYGITKVNLPQFNFKLTSRKTHIKDIRLFYDNVDLLDFSSSTKLDNILPADLNFPFYQNHLSFDFVSINLRNPDAIYYRYMLEGFDKHWSPVNKANLATYTNLDPGKYIFKVQESDHPDHWDESYESIAFDINFPYWERWWFYLLQITFIITVIFLTYYLSARLRSQFAVRLMVYVSVFIAFEYVHTEVEPFIENLTGETPIFQVGFNLLLALMLLPIEIRLTRYLKQRAEVRANKKEATAASLEI